MVGAGYVCVDEWGWGDVGWGVGVMWGELWECRG